MRTRLFPVLVVAASVLVAPAVLALNQSVLVPCFFHLFRTRGRFLRSSPVPSSRSPGTGSPIPQSLDPHGINDRSQIVGSFGRHGFLRTNGEYLTIDVPNADSTEAWGINSRTQIVGRYVVNGQSHGFLLEDGRFTTVDPPGATSAAA
jgi:hypothetical protein